LHFTVEKGFFPEEPPSFFPFHSSAWLDRFGEGTEKEHEKFIRLIMISYTFQIAILPLAATASVKTDCPSQFGRSIRIKTESQCVKILTVLKGGKSAIVGGRQEETDHVE
jgi:hypothetical protein